MLKLGLRNVVSHRLRVALCIMSVLLGVAFVAGSLIFTDTVSAGLRRTVAATTADLTVTPRSELERGGSGLGTGNARPPLLTAEQAAKVATVPGVATADAQLVVGGIHLLDKSGSPYETSGLPIFGASWPHDRATATFSVLEGSAPWGPAELAMDRSTARRAGYAVGDTVRVITAGRTVDARLTGLVTTASTGTAAGSPLVAFDPATAQLMLLGGAGWTSIAVDAGPGADLETLRTRIQAVVGDGAEVRTALQVVADAESSVDETFGGASGVLLMFAGLALFIGTFLIANTFAMLITQRVRELGMLRAVGASRAQVTRSVLVEAVVIGAIGSTLGLLTGLGLVAALRSAFESLGIPVPDYGLQLRPRTVVWCYLVGVGVTVVSAYLPARRAGRVPPVAALREDVSLPARSMRARLVVGAVVFLMAACGYAIGTQAVGLPGALLVGLSAGIALIGLTMVNPVVGRYAVAAMTAPLRGRTALLLGGKNAARSPRRTGATASALMISMALVSGLAVLAGSAKASIDTAVTDAFGTADFVISGAEGQAFGGDVATAARAVPGVASVGRRRVMAVEVDGHRVRVTGVDPGVLRGPMVVHPEAGSLDRIDAGEVVLPRNLTRTLGAKVGDTLTIITATGRHRLRVGAEVAASQQLDAVIVSLDVFGRLGGADTDSAVYVVLRDGVAPAAVAQRLNDAVAVGNPLITVRDQSQYAAAQRRPVDVMVGVVYLLLALAVLISILGIVNTLLLSVLERTREIGLLRAVGMDRPQVRAMVRIEAVSIALVGALLGVCVGVGFAAGVQRAMRDDGLRVLDLPVLQLVVLLAVAALVGVLAALWPARRAARLDVLRAIATE